MVVSSPLTSAPVRVPLRALVAALLGLAVLVGSVVAGHRRQLRLAGHGRRAAR